MRTSFSGLSVQGAVEGLSTAHAARAWPGSALPGAVATRMAQLGYDCFSVCDVDTVAGIVRAHAQAQEHRLRLIVGVELWLDEGPLLLHCASATGYANLCEILTQARAGVDKGCIAHDLDVVCARAEGLFACVLPPFAERIGDLKDAFGERLSIGVFRHQTPEDAPRLSWARQRSVRYDVPLLATARAVLRDRADKRFHDVMTCIRQGLVLHSAGQRLMPNAEAVVRAPREMCAIFADLPAALRRSRAIADACTFELGALRYAFPTDDGAPQERLEALVWAGAKRRYGVGDKAALPEPVRTQLVHELSLIAKLEVAPYFLTVYEIVEIARDLGILCQGRGSAANSVVCFCLGITAIDPVKMGLLFERFLSVERGEPPDIDVDFEHERREEVIQAIYDRWGRDHAAMVCNVIAFRGRSAVREVGKVFGLSETVCGKLSGLMWRSGLSELSARRLREAGIQASAHDVERTLTFARQLQGHPRHLGIHVGGFVLTQAPITTLAPVEPARMEGRTVLPFDKDDVETLGLFKMDVLGLGMLTCLRKGFELLDRVEDLHVELHTIPAEDPAVYAAIGRADTIGVFQIESRAQMSMLPRLAPRTFYDLVIEVAIIRPGPIQGGMVHPYLRRRDGEEPIEYPHPDLRPILERTLGVPLFQEQVMKLAVVGAGYTPGQADQLRRDMAAWRKRGKLQRHRERLIRGFENYGISTDFAERLFAQIQGFGEYGFPESHAASFAILAYASAWLKVHHPAIFTAALLNSQPMGFYSTAQLVSDAQHHGVEVRPVSVNHSDDECTLERDVAHGPLKLRLGLRTIKGLAADEAERIARARRKRGRDFVDVHEVFRVCQISAKGQRALAKSGARDGLCTHRRVALWGAMQKELPLFERLPDDDAAAVLRVPAAHELLEMDYAHAGVSLDDHPMIHLRPQLLTRLKPHRRLCTARDLTRVPHGTRVWTAGLVTGRQRPGTADGTCFITLEDETGMTNVIVWGRDFEAWRQVVVTSSFLLAQGTLERQGRVVHLIAARLEKVQPHAEPLPYRSRDFH